MSKITRFSVGRRIEHLALIVVFTLLVITGIPQKFPEVGLSSSVVELFGGLAAMRAVHRVCGLVLTGMAVVHLVAAVVAAARGHKHAFAMVPRRKDFSDAIQQLRYYLGIGQTQARFDRYDYRQKFEYWGVVIGTIIICITGFILLAPTTVTSFLPGQVIPAAKLAHGNEGLLALLVIVIWHMYNAHFNPEVFPFDTTIFSGKISRTRMEHEHPLELEAMESEEGRVGKDLEKGKGRVG